jgi:hypothetical protein
LQAARQALRLRIAENKNTLLLVTGGRRPGWEESGGCERQQGRNRRASGLFAATVIHGRILYSVLSVI